MFENPRTGKEARNFTTNVPKILDPKSSSEQIFSENWRWVSLFPDSRTWRPSNGRENSFRVKNRKVDIRSYQA